jgi:hypothetical protein
LAVEPLYGSLCHTIFLSDCADIGACALYRALARPVQIEFLRKSSVRHKVRGEAKSFGQSSMPLHSQLTTKLQAKFLDQGERNANSRPYLFTIHRGGSPVFGFQQGQADGPVARNRNKTIFIAVSGRRGMQTIPISKAT